MSLSQRKLYRLRSSEENARNVSWETREYPYMSICNKSALRLLWHGFCYFFERFRSINGKIYSYYHGTLSFIVIYNVFQWRLKELTARYILSQFLSFLKIKSFDIWKCSCKWRNFRHYLFYILYLSHRRVWRKILFRELMKNGSRERYSKHSLFCIGFCELLRRMQRKVEIDAIIEENPVKCCGKTRLLSFFYNNCVSFSLFLCLSCKNIRLAQSLTFKEIENIVFYRRIAKHVFRKLKAFRCMRGKSSSVLSEIDVWKGAEINIISDSISPLSFILLIRKCARFQLGIFYRGERDTLWNK